MRLLILLSYSASILFVTVGCANERDYTTEITLEVNTPEIIEELAMASESNLFREIQKEALNRLKKGESNYLDLFIEVHNELYPKRALIKTFGTEEAINQLTLRAPDDETKKYLAKKVDDTYNKIGFIEETRLNSMNIFVGKTHYQTDRNQIILEVTDIPENQKSRIAGLLNTNVSVQFLEAYSLDEMGDFMSTFYEQKMVAKVSENNPTDVIDDLLESERRERMQDSLRENALKNALKFRGNIEAIQNYSNTPEIGFGMPSEKDRIMDSLNSLKKELMKSNYHFYWGAKPVHAVDASNSFLVLYALKPNQNEKEKLNASHILSSEVKIDPNTGAMTVYVVFNNEGTDRLNKITTEHYNKFMAIVVNNEVVSCALINSPITEGEMVISGGLDKPEAENLSSLLSAGSLPASCEVIRIDKVKSRNRK